MLEVFTQRNFAADLIYSIEVEFYSRKQKIVLSHPLWDLGGNVHTPSRPIARWKARCQLPIRHLNVYAISYG